MDEEVLAFRYWFPRKEAAKRGKGREIFNWCLAGRASQYRIPKVEKRGIGNGGGGWGALRGRGTGKKTNPWVRNYHGFGR